MFGCVDSREWDRSVLGCGCARAGFGTVEATQYATYSSALLECASIPMRGQRLPLDVPVYAPRVAAVKMAREIS